MNWQKWILCADRLPPYSEIVILDSEMGIVAGWLERTDKDGPHWFRFEIPSSRFRDGDSAVIRTSHVLRWQPLPSENAAEVSA